MEVRAQESLQALRSSSQNGDVASAVRVEVTTDHFLKSHIKYVL